MLGDPGALLAHGQDITVTGRGADRLESCGCRLLEAASRSAEWHGAGPGLYQSTATLAEDMRRAMETRAVIEQAKGILIAQQHCTPEQAFELLTRLSQTTHRNLRDRAAGLSPAQPKIAPLTGREFRLRKKFNTERAAQIELGKLLEQASAAPAWRTEAWAAIWTASQGLPSGGV